MERKDVLERLKILHSVFGRRQVGHTTLLVSGAKNYDREFGIISHKMDFSNQLLNLSENKMGKAFSINNLSSLIGSKIPVAMDNAAWTIELERVISVLESCKSESEVQRMIESEVDRNSRSFNTVIKDLIEIAELYQERSHKTESAIMEYALCKPWEFRKKSKLKTNIINLITESNSDKRIPELFKSLNQLIKK